MENLTVIEIFAYVGVLINDLVATLGFIGSLILLLGSFGKASWRNYGPLAKWSGLGLVFGWLFQLSMAFTGTTSEQIGMIFRMSPLLVYALLSLSLLMVIGRIVIRRLLRSGK